MDINIKNQLQKILDRQLETTTETRFRIEGYSKETVQEMLLMCYQHEVRKRRIPFQEDKGTLEKIEKAAKWLTGDYKSRIAAIWNSRIRQIYFRQGDL